MSKHVQFERNVQFYGICHHVPEKLNIYATCPTFMTLEGKTRLRVYFFPPFNHSQRFSACRLLLQNARGWVVYKPQSQFWRLEVQDQGASMVA